MDKAIWAALMAMVFSVAAYAKDEPITIDGKHILVTDVSKSGYGNGQLHSADFKNGVYIVAGSLDQRFPNAEKAIAESFKAKGLPVVDKLEDAGVAIVFNTMLSLDLAKADQAAKYSAMPNAGQVVSGAGGLAGAAMNSAGRIAGGGATGVVGYLAGALFETDSKLIISAISYKSPSAIKTWRGNFIKANDGDSAETAKVFYKLEKGKEASINVVLKMAVDQWISQYVVFDGIAPTREVAAPVATAPTDSSIQAMDEK